MIFTVQIAEIAIKSAVFSLKKKILKAHILV